MAWIPSAVLLGLWLGLCWGRYSSNRRGAFIRGYCHGWHDACAGVQEFEEG